MAKKKILFVCTGNTCRSPMAAALLERMLAEDDGAQDFVVESAGLAAPEGAPATPEAVRVMAEEGIDLSRHRARRLAPELVEEAALVITMTRQHKEAVLRIVPRAKGKVFTLKELTIGAEAQAAASRGEELQEQWLDVRDPFGRSEEAYRRCFAELKEHLEKLLPKIRENST